MCVATYSYILYYYSFKETCKTVGALALCLLSYSCKHIAIYLYILRIVNIKSCFNDSCVGIHITRNKHIASYCDVAMVVRSYITRQLVTLWYLCNYIYLTSNITDYMYVAGGLFTLVPLISLNGLCPKLHISYITHPKLHTSLCVEYLL